MEQKGLEIEPSCDYSLKYQNEDFMLPSYEKCKELYPQNLDNIHVGGSLGNSLNNNDEFADLVPYDLYIRNSSGYHRSTGQLLKHAKLEELIIENDILPTYEIEKQIISSMEHGDLDQIKSLLDSLADPNYIDPQTGCSLINLAIMFGGWEKHVNVFSGEKHVNVFSGEKHVNVFSGEKHVNVFSGEKHVNVANNEKHVNVFSGEKHVNVFSGEKHVNCFQIPKPSLQNQEIIQHITKIYNPTKKAIENSLAVVNILLRIGADINKHDKRGKTPLFCACENELIGFVTLLVLNKADIDKPTLTGISPITVATALGNARIVLFLLDHGAKIPSEPNTINNVFKISMLYNKHVIFHILQDRVLKRRANNPNNTKIPPVMQFSRQNTSGNNARKLVVIPRDFVVGSAVAQGPKTSNFAKN